MWPALAGIDLPATRSAAQTTFTPCASCFLEIYVAGIDWNLFLYRTHRCTNHLYCFAYYAIYGLSLFPIRLVAPVEHVPREFSFAFWYAYAAGLGIDAAAGDLPVDGVPIVFQDPPSAALRLARVVRLLSRRHGRRRRDRVQPIEVGTPHEEVRGLVGIPTVNAQ